MICLELNPSTGDLRPINPQPVDLSTCSLVAGNYAETGPSELWQLTPAQGAEIGMSIMLVWSVAFGYRMVIKALSVGDSTEKE